MRSLAIDLDEASTTELVEAASAIAAKLAEHAPPESAAACFELTEKLARATDQHENTIAGFVAVVDNSGEAQRWGLPSTQSWLRSRLGMRDARAKERLTLARHHHRLPTLTARWAAGDLSYGYAATITAAITRLNDTDCAAAETILLDMVDQHFSAGKIATFGRRIRNVIAERDGTEPAPDDTRRGYDNSWIDATRSLDGGRYLKGWLNAEDAAIWDGTLAPPATPAGTHDPRDRSERTAAALTGVLSGGHKATKVTLICDLDTLTGGTAPARLTDGTPIPAEQARRIALAAGVSPLILGRGSIPLYLGYRHRFASPGQRQVLEALYPTCAVQGCEVPGTGCEVDHVNGWALGNSPTNIDELALTCGWHNRHKHANPAQMHITKGQDGRYRYRVLPPDQPRTDLTATPHTAVTPDFLEPEAPNPWEHRPASSAGHRVQLRPRHHVTRPKPARPRGQPKGQRQTGGP